MCKSSMQIWHRAIYEDILYYCMSRIFRHNLDWAFWNALTLLRTLILKKILILFMNIFSCLSVKAVKWGFRSPVVGFIGACPWVKNCPARHPSTLPNGQNRHWNRKERKRLSQPTPLSWPLANEQSSSSSHFYPFFSLSWREAVRPKFMPPL